MGWLFRVGWAFWVGQVLCGWLGVFRIGRFFLAYWLLPLMKKGIMSEPFSKWISLFAAADSQ